MDVMGFMNTFLTGQKLKGLDPLECYKAINEYCDEHGKSSVTEEDIDKIRDKLING